MTSVTLDPDCNGSPRAQPILGHFVELTVDLSTSPTMPPTLGRVLLDPQNMQIIGTDGSIHANVDDHSADSCVIGVNTAPKDPFVPGRH